MGIFKKSPKVRRPSVRYQHAMSVPSRRRSVINIRPARSGGYPRGRVGRRGFDAAATDRLTQSWLTSPQTIDEMLKGAWETLVARSRERSLNDDQAVRFLGIVENGVVGPEGVKLQARPGQFGKDGKFKLDAVAARLIEEKFNEWTLAASCDVAGGLSWQDFQRQAIRTVARDGDALFRMVRRKFDGRYVFQMQELDPVSLDINANFDARQAGGNIIRMGVEMDAWRRPVAYHLRGRPTDEYYGSSVSRDHARVPADEMIHLFVPKFPCQSRGIPWMHSALRRMQYLEKLENAALVAAETGASVMAVIEGWNPNTASGDGYDSDSNEMLDIEAGRIMRLTDGESIGSFNPDYPDAQFAPLRKNTLQSTASGLMVSYVDFANDLEGVSFSSIRQGTLADRDYWMWLQAWLIRDFVSRVFDAWLESALLNGEIAFSNGAALPASKLDKFRRAKFQGRRWDWVDPRSDMESHKTAIAIGLETKSEVIRKSGRDPEDVFEERAEEREKELALGLVSEAEEDGGWEGAPDDEDDE